MRKVLVCLLLATLVFPVSGFELSAVKDALRSDYEYLRDVVEQVSGGGAVSLRAMALHGIFAASIHMGLGDAESLNLLNKIAEQVNTSALKGDGVDVGFTGKIPTAENFLTHLQTSYFAALHYGLTRSQRSREVLNILGDSLEGFLGWTPVYSKAAMLVQANWISKMTGGSVNKEEIQYAVSSYADHFQEIVAFSTQNDGQLIQSLTALSRLLTLAHEADVEAPIELSGLWRVHVDYVANLTAVNNPETDFETASRAFAALVDAAENQQDTYSSTALENVFRLLDKMEKLYYVGDRLLTVETQVSNLLLYDPAASAEQVFAAARQKTSAVNIVYPTALASLRKMTSRNIGSFEVVVSKLSTASGYYPLFERAVVQSDEYVNRFLRSSLFSVILALERQPAAMVRNLAVERFVSNSPVSTAVLAVLVLLALLNRIGVLYRRG